MDTNADFKGWNKTIESWSKNYKTAKSSLNKFKPVLYKILIYADKNISKDHYEDIFNIIFRVKDIYIIAKSFFDDGQVSFGPFTKEIAEQKIHTIINYGSKKSTIFKCKIVKDDKEYVIKKS